MVTGGHLRPRTLEQKEAIRDALRAHVMPKWASGELQKPEVMEVIRLEEAGRAHKMLEQKQGNTVIGKVVLQAWP